MGKPKFIPLAMLSAGVCLLLAGCGTVDESILNMPANFSVDINVPYATVTPKPDYLNVPDAIVIDSDGNVTLNDTSIIEGDFQSVRDQAEQTEYRTLSLGNTGLAVQALQTRLKELGYYTSDVSGLFDSETETAVRRFEQTYGTMQTGVATQKLQLKLFASNAPVYGSDEYDAAVVSQYSVLRPGAVGSSVYALQQRLKNLGYPITELTGVYDTQTTQCVRLFYMSYGLTGTDVANVAMQKELYSDSAIAYDPSVRLANLTAGVLTLPGEEAEPDEATSISLGSSGTRVLQVQQKLIALGYLEADRDTGVFDEPTQSAVNLFLTAVGRKADGSLSEEMQDYLLSDRAPSYEDMELLASYRTLSPGDKNNAVLRLQRRLIELGYGKGNPTGGYGRATASAVAVFQQVNGLEPDGIASPYMQVLLYDKNALTYQEMLNGPNSLATPKASNQPTPSPTPAPTPTPEPTPLPPADTIFFNLSVGSRGNAVSTLQARLIALGFMEDAAGDVYDETTKAAVCAFQAALGLPQTGEASPTMQRYMFSQAAPRAGMTLYAEVQDFEILALGDSGEAVENLQKWLYSFGYLDKDDVEEIGVYDEATQIAVYRAQRNMRYQNPDGVAGAEFQSFLYSRYGTYISLK